MNPSVSHVRIASSLVRTMVVGSATLAILLVCFSIYQFGQRGTESWAATREPRLPPTPTEQPTDSPASAGDVSGGVPVGQGVVGPGRNIRLAVYPREGTRARFEIAVSSWVPIDGSLDEFRLTDPELRMRTDNGHAVRVTARRGSLQARRRAGGVEPQRGRLSGEVLVEIDRWTEQQRASFPADRRDRHEPEDLVTVRMEDIEFDLDTSRVQVAGPFALSARDIRFEGEGLEVRFDQTSNSLEYLLVPSGGILTLIGGGSGLDFGRPGSEETHARRRTIVDWMRDAIRAGLQQRIPDAAVEADGGLSETVAPDRSPIVRPPSVSAMAEGGSTGEASRGKEPTSEPPVFTSRESTGSVAKPPVFFLARFEKEVDARQEINAATHSRLRCETLEVLRGFDPERSGGILSTDRSSASRPGTQSLASRATGDVESPEALRVTWTGRLLLKSLTPEESMNSAESRPAIVAEGKPVQLSGPEGTAECDVFHFHPSTSQTRLIGGGRGPALVRSADEGVITGTEIVLQESGRESTILVRGPGTFRRKGDGASNEAISGVASDPESPSPRSVLPATPVDSSSDDSIALGAESNQTGDKGTSIEFSDQLEARGRIVTETSVNLSAGLVRRRRRVLDQAHFTGNVRLHEDEAEVTAEEVTVMISSTGGSGRASQKIDRVTASGNVNMNRGDDRMSGRRIDVRFVKDASGRSIPSRAVAEDEVAVIQGNRSIRARDKLIVEFAPRESEIVIQDGERAVVPREIPESSSSVSEGASKSARSHPGKGTSLPSKDLSVRALSAWGDVLVIDSDRSIELTAEELDCVMADDREIATALVVGMEDQPASVRFDSFSVQGVVIHLNVAEQTAEVPGAGRLSFRSRRDLDGRKTDSSTLITVDWLRWMKYQGRENRAVFDGRVHAVSENTTTFDAPRLVVEFEEFLPPDEAPVADWSTFRRFAGRLTGRAQERRSATPMGFSKEVAALHATGGAVVETSQFDATTDLMESRARITGPKLSVNLRKETSKLLIEGAGNLLLEDMRPVSAARSSSRSTADAGTGLFNIEEDSGESATLIEWRDLMWYDFSIEQTRFEGDVVLTHFSGEELRQAMGIAGTRESESHPGRRTFLQCAVLTADFLARNHARETVASPRMGRLRSDRLRQFQASGDVKLQDQGEGLWLSADTVIYERERSLLSVHGSMKQKAHIVIQKPGEFPQNYSAARFFYNLATKLPEASEPVFRGR